MSSRNRATTSRGVRATSRRPTVQAQQSFAYGSVGQPVGAPDLKTQTALENTETVLEAGIQTSMTREGPRQSIDEHALDDIPEDEEPLSIIESKEGNEIDGVHANHGAGASGGAGNDEDQTHQHSTGPSNQPQNAISHAFSIWFNCKWFSWVFAVFAIIGLILSMMNLDNAGYLSKFQFFPRPVTNISLDAWNSNTIAVDTLTHRLDSFATGLNSYTQRLESLESWTRSLSRSQPTAALQPKVHKVNYFSTGLGAVIDPWLTSPTKPGKLVHSFEAGFVARFFGWNTFVLREPYAPVEALGPWQDIGDCWCAPPAKGKAQLGVILPRHIVPTELVIEHIPRDATLDIGSAPKDVELWVQIHDAQDRDAVENAAFGTFQPDGESPLEARLNHDYFVKALDHTWVRIGKWRYDIFTGENVQTFPVAIHLEDFGVRVNKVAVRVKTNWGDRDYVCLYRLRLHGLLREDDPMYQDSAPIQTGTIFGN